MEEQLSQKLKERLIKQMEDDKSDQHVVLGHSQHNHRLPSENLSSKDMSYFSDKDHKDIGSYFDDKQQQQEQRQVPSKDNYFNKKQSGLAALANKEDSATNDSPAHMIHVGISHDKTNDTDFAIVCCVFVCICVCAMCIVCLSVCMCLCVCVSV